VCFKSLHISTKHRYCITIGPYTHETAKKLRVSCISVQNFWSPRRYSGCVYGFRLDLLKERLLQEMWENRQFCLHGVNCVSVHGVFAVSQRRRHSPEDPKSTSQRRHLRYAPTSHTYTTNTSYSLLSAVATTTLLSASSLFFSVSVSWSAALGPSSMNFCENILPYQRLHKGTFRLHRFWFLRSCFWTVNFITRMLYLYTNNSAEFQVQALTIVLIALGSIKFCYNYSRLYCYPHAVQPLNVTYRSWDTLFINITHFVKTY